MHLSHVLLLGPIQTPTRDFQLLLWWNDLCSTDGIILPFHNKPKPDAPVFGLKIRRLTWDDQPEGPEFPRGQSLPGPSLKRR